MVLKSCLIALKTMQSIVRSVYQPSQENPQEMPLLANQNAYEYDGFKMVPTGKPGIILNPRCDVCESRSCHGHGANEIALKEYCRKAIDICEDVEEPELLPTLFTEELTLISADAVEDDYSEESRP
jgi:hypothetical protein